MVYGWALNVRLPEEVSRLRHDLPAHGVAMGRREDNDTTVPPGGEI